MYGPESLRPIAFGRQALHAFRLEFEHPADGRRWRSRRRSARPRGPPRAAPPQGVDSQGQPLPLSGVRACATARSVLLSPPVCSRLDLAVLATAQIAPAAATAGEAAGPRTAAAATEIPGRIELRQGRRLPAQERQAGLRLEGGGIRGLRGRRAAEGRNLRARCRPAGGTAERARRGELPAGVAAGGRKSPESGVRHLPRYAARDGRQRARGSTSRSFG